MTVRSMYTMYALLCQCSIWKLLFTTSFGWHHVKKIVAVVMVSGEIILIQWFPILLYEAHVFVVVVGTLSLCDDWWHSCFIFWLFCHVIMILFVSVISDWYIDVNHVYAWWCQRLETGYHNTISDSNDSFFQCRMMCGSVLHYKWEHVTRHENSDFVFRINQ